MQGRCQFINNAVVRSIHGHGLAIDCLQAPLVHPSPHILLIQVTTQLLKDHFHFRLQSGRGVRISGSQNTEEVLESFARALVLSSNDTVKLGGDAGVMVQTVNESRTALKHEWIYKIEDI